MPLVWQVYERQSAMLAFEDYKGLLEHVLTLLPEGVHIVLMGDRGFRTTDLMAWCDAHPGWHFRLRLKGSQEVNLPDGRITSLADVPLRPGMVHFLHEVLLGQEGYGPIDIAIAGLRGPMLSPGTSPPMGGPNTAGAWIWRRASSTTN